VKLPVATTDRPAPVVTDQAPLTLYMPIGIWNGTRLLSAFAPPANTVTEVAPSRIAMAPGDTEVGITVRVAR
jgi:hypothetical protein